VRSTIEKAREYMEKGAHLVVRGFLIFCGKNAHSDS
jgi:hypothetical protein